MFPGPRCRRSAARHERKRGRPRSARSGAGRYILYPLTGRPGVDLPNGWDAIPGARGCTPEACGFRDHHADLQAAGARAVYGLSSQTTEYQAELAARLGLPFPILWTPIWRSPTRSACRPSRPGERLFSRLTLVVTDRRIEHAFYPIFPPDQHAAEVLEWLRGHAAVGR